MPAKSTKKSANSSKKAANSSILADTNITGALSYFPYFIGALAMYFLAEDRKAILKHIKYSVLLAFAAVILMILLNQFFAWVFNLAYWGFSAFLAFKAYK